jgi:hypothetical protein
VTDQAAYAFFERPTKGGEMYIGAGAIVLILLIILLVYMLG